MRAEQENDVKIVEVHKRSVSARSGAPIAQESPPERCSSKLMECPDVMAQFLSDRNLCLVGVGLSGLNSR